MTMQDTARLHWVERLFARLQVRYGSAWNLAWEGIAPDAVKADWEQTLRPVFERNPQAIAHALTVLPDRPPTADVFRRLCNAAPQPLPALPGPREPIPAGVAQALQGLKPVPSDMSPAQQCAERLRSMQAGGARLTMAQLAMLAACERVGAAVVPC
jgi:hypothetical protein